MSGETLSDSAETSGPMKDTDAMTEGNPYHVLETGYHGTLQYRTLYSTHGKEVRAVSPPHPSTALHKTCNFFFQSFNLLLWNLYATILNYNFSLASSMWDSQLRTVV